MLSCHLGNTLHSFATQSQNGATNSVRILFGGGKTAFAQLSQKRRIKILFSVISRKEKNTSFSGLLISVLPYAPGFFDQFDFEGHHIVCFNIHIVCVSVEND